MRDQDLRITVLSGTTKDGEQELLDCLDLASGEIVALVGPTGSGKSQLLSDIEQRAAGDTPSKRTVLIHGDAVDADSRGLIAQLSQTMRFVIDMAVADFLSVHAASRGLDRSVVDEVIALANRLTGEPMAPESPMTTLSGGQSRALMIADIALISRAPIVLIDEIENAGIDKLQALETLSEEGKIVLIASHDPVVVLMAQRRVVMKNGGMSRLLHTSLEEDALLYHLVTIDREMGFVRERLRNGDQVAHESTLETNRRLN